VDKKHKFPENGEWLFDFQIYLENWIRAVPIQSDPAVMGI
jgi:hypothetical protein